jgi:hypothetical protein
MRGPPVSRRFLRRARLSARRRRVAATRPRRTPRLKGAVGTARQCPDRTVSVPCSDRLATCVADRRYPLLTARVRERHAAVLADTAVYPVRRRLGFWDLADIMLEVD